MHIPQLKTLARLLRGVAGSYVFPFVTDRKITNADLMLILSRVGTEAVHLCAA